MSSKKANAAMQLRAYEEQQRQLQQRKQEESATAQLRAYEAAQTRAANRTYTSPVMVQQAAEKPKSWVEKYSNWQPATTQPKTITQNRQAGAHLSGIGGGRRTPLPSYTAGDASSGAEQSRTAKGEVLANTGGSRRAAVAAAQESAEPYRSTADRLLGDFLQRLADIRSANPHATWTQDEIESAYKQYVQDYYAALDVDATKRRSEETANAFYEAKADYEDGIFGKAVQLNPEGTFRPLEKPSKMQKAPTTLEDVARLQNEMEGLSNDIELAKSVQYDRAGSETLTALREKDKVGTAALDTLVKGADTTGLKGHERQLARQSWEEHQGQTARNTLRNLGYSDDEIEELVEYRKREQNRDKYESESASLTGLAEKGFLGRTVATGVRLMSGIPMGVAGALDLAAQRASEKPVDWYSPGIAANRIESDIVNTVSGELAKKYDAEIAGQNVAAFLYQTGISMGDSAVIAGMTAMGIPAWLGTAALGTMAGTQAAIDAHERGISDSKAFTTGLMAGIAETVFEKISLEMLLKPGAVDGSTMRKKVLQVLRNLGVQSFTEGTEEVFTDLANAMTDRWINGGQSEFNANVRRYQLSGMSEEEAYEAATRDFAIQVGTSYVGGFISGEVTSGGMQIIQTAGANEQAKAVYGVDPQALVDEALEIDPNNKTAQKAEAKLEQGKQLSGGDLRLLVEQNQAKIAEAGHNEDTAAADDTTAVNDDPAEHTPGEQRVIEEYKDAVDPALVEFYEKAKSETTAKKEAKAFEMQPVSDRAVEDIKRLTGVNTAGFRTLFDVRQANHIYLDHGENGRADHTMADANDVGRMQYVLDNYDTVEDGGRTRAYFEKNAKGGNSPAKSVRFSKKVNGTYFVVEAVPNTNARAVNVVSAYMLADGKTPVGKNNKGAAQQTADVYTPQPNGRTAPVVTTPTNSIPQTGAKSQGKSNGRNMTGEAAKDLVAIEQDHRRKGADEEALGEIATAFRVAYLYGTTGKLQASDRADLRAMGLNEDEINLAFSHGRAAVNGNAQQIMKGEQNNERTGVRVRDGSQRNGGESAGGQSKGMERGSGVRQEQSARRGGAEAQSGTDGETGASQSSTRALIGEAGSERGGRVYTVVEHYSEDTAAAAKIARQRGVDAVFFTGGELTLASGVTARGYIDLKHGKVWVRADDPQYSAEQIMRHELGHEAVAKGEIDPGTVYDRLAKRYGEKNMERIMALYSELYENANLSADEVWEEILCDSLADMNVFSDLSAVTELVEDFLHSTKEEAQQNAKENANNGNKKSADTGGKASLRVEFGAELDAWNGKSKRVFHIGTTSETLQSLGVESRNIIWRGGKISDIMQKHPAMTREIIKQVPEILEHPVAVLESKQSDSRLVLFGTVYDAQRDPVTAILELQPTTRGGELMDMNVIASAYGKSRNAAQFVRSSGLVYLDENKNRTEKWMQSVGLQLPADTTIFGSIGRITYLDGKVKIESVPYEQYMQKGGRYTRPGQKTTATIDGKTSRVADGLEQLQEENRELREQVKEFQKALRSAERRIQGARESRDQWRDRATFHTERVCREIIKAYNGTVREEDIHDGIKKLTYYAARKDGITYEAMKNLATPVAAQVVKSASAVMNDEEAQTWSDLKKHLRAGHIKVSREVVHDIDEWGDFWRRNGRRLNLVTGKDGISVDAAYDELRERFGEAYFPERIAHPADQLRRIAEVYDNLQPVFENPYSLNLAMATEHCANDLVDMVMKEVSRGYMATYTGQLEEKLYQSRKYTEKLLEKERAHSDEQIRALKKHWQEQRAREIEGRQDSELRQRLLNVAKRLKNKKLPTVSRALLHQYTEQILTEAQRDIFSRLDTESRSMRSSTREGLTWLRDQYEFLEATDPNFIPDPATQERIKRLSKLQIDSLTHQDVVELTYVLLNIENEIRNAKHLIDSAEKRDLREAGVAIMRDIKNSPGSKASGVGNFLDRFIVTETLSPLRQVRRMVGYVENDPLLTATRELADGQRRSFDYKMRAQARFQKYVDDRAFMDRIAGKHAELMTIRGIGENDPTEVQITPAMKISLYLHSKNNQSLTHIAGGGIRVPDAALYRQGKVAEAYARGTVVKLEAGEVKKIAANLTAEERRFADAVFDYFNTMSKEEVNAVSEKLLGYPVAEVENYFPINTDDSFTKKDFESIKFDGSIEGMGFLKERIKSAAPIYLRDVTDVLLRSID
ncbi:MAG: hypothetical protein J5482_02940, partial [Oscillospiraceae bacterium]|nr:hypothetical protein [Oscillospiraceae bacterium]